MKKKKVDYDDSFYTNAPDDVAEAIRGGEPVIDDLPIPEEITANQHLERDTINLSEASVRFLNHGHGKQEPPTRLSSGVCWMIMQNGTWPGNKQSRKSCSGSLSREEC